MRFTYKATRLGMDDAVAGSPRKMPPKVYLQTKRNIRHQMAKQRFTNDSNRYLSISFLVYILGGGGLL